MLSRLSRKERSPTLKSPRLKKKRVEVNNGIISLSETADNVSVYNIAGEKQIEAKNCNSLNIAHLNGRYFIAVVRNGNNIQTYKVSAR